MLLVGAAPNLIAGRSIESLTFEYRDYFLRVFVVFLVAHLFTRQTSFRLLLAIPPATLALQLALDVYQFTEWYSQTFRVNLHEINAQLFVVPIQVAVMLTGVVFCFRGVTRTTTRIFATTMMVGSIISTFCFHLAIVNVSYKPIERLYSDTLERVSDLESPDEVCETVGFKCQSFELGQPDWPANLRRDPQMYKAHELLLQELMATHFWIERGDGAEHTLGMADVSDREVVAAELLLPSNVLLPALQYVFAEEECSNELGYLCWDFGSDSERPHLTEYSASILNTISGDETFLHTWVYAYDFDLDGPGLSLPALMVAGRVNGGHTRVAISKLPQYYLDTLRAALESGRCHSSGCQVLDTNKPEHADTPQVLQALIESLNTNSYDSLQVSWVDKAISANPVLYINRPEFLRAKSYQAGTFRVVTTPQAFSDSTLDIKISFNLIIAIFSTSWLTFGVFLTLFHTRRQLLRS